MSHEDPGRPTTDDHSEDSPETESPYPWMRLDPDEDPAPPFRPWMIVVAGLSVVIFLVAVWYAWNEGQSVSEGPPPVVEADDTPAKTRPEEPGGMDVPHQDKTVFNAIEDDGNGDGATDEEELLPPPEEPVERPAEPSDAEADAGMDETSASQQADSETAGGDTEEESEETAAAPAATADGDGEAAPEPGAEDETAPADSEEAAPAETQAQTAEDEPAATATGGYVIQLAALGSRDAAEDAWARFLKAYPRLLGPLTLDVQPVEANGSTLYRVRAAGIADRARAEALCRDLEDQGQSCLVKER